MKHQMLFVLQQQQQTTTMHVCSYIELKLVGCQKGNKSQQADCMTRRNKRRQKKEANKHLQNKKTTNRKHQTYINERSNNQTNTENIKHNQLAFSRLVRV